MDLKQIARDQNRHNGWKNYETWNVKLWMDNEQNSSEYWGQIAQDLYDAAEARNVFTKEEQAKIDIADRLKDEHETAKDEWLEESGKSCSMWADLLGAALSEVDWGEIADNLLEDVDKEEEAAEAE